MVSGELPISRALFLRVRNSHATIRNPLIAPAGLLLALCSCLEPNQQPAPYRRDLAPTLDRMVAAYEDLSARRFQVLADFETPEQASLFRLETPLGSVPLSVTTERARNETGVGSLKIPLTSSSQQVVAVERPEGQWSLHRDWSKHHMLLFNVFSPRRLGGLTLSVQSGTQFPLSYTHPRIFLGQGWNLLRIDLADMSEQVNLADVRELRLWCEPLEAPVDLYLDDVVLVDNTREIFGPAPGQGAPGDLYVRLQGRRIVVGAADRFELTFARGRIRQWFDLGRDPARTHNLTGPGPLGPIPLVLGPDGTPLALDEVGQWAALGPAAETYQTLVEASALRVVVQGECRFGRLDSGIPDDSPYHLWMYSVYRDGRVYVSCTGTGHTEMFQPAGLGMAFCCDGAMGFQRLTLPDQAAMTVSVPDGPARDREPQGYALFSRSGRGEADLLVVPASPGRLRLLDNPHDSRSCVMWELPATDLFTFAAMVRVWPADVDGPDQAGPMADDYRRPLPLAIDVGRLVRTDPGDLDHDGFSETGGYYVLQLEGNIARIRIDGMRQMRFWPVFKLIDVADRDVWVYVDGRQIRDLHRDDEGQVMFAVPTIITRETLIEITARRRETPSP